MAGPTEEPEAVDLSPEEGDWLYEAVLGDVVCDNGSESQNIQMPTGTVPITKNTDGTIFWVDFGNMILEFEKVSPGLFETVPFLTSGGPPETPITIELVWQLLVETTELMTGTMTGDTSENCILTHFITLTKLND